MYQNVKAKRRTAFSGITVFRGVPWEIWPGWVSVSEHDMRVLTGVLCNVGWAAWAESVICLPGCSLACHVVSDESTGWHRHNHKHAALKTLTLRSLWNENLQYKHSKLNLHQLGAHHQTGIRKYTTFVPCAARRGCWQCIWPPYIMFWQILSSSVIHGSCEWHRKKKIIVDPQWTVSFTLSTHPDSFYVRPMQFSTLA